MTSSPRTRLAGLSILSLAAALMTVQPAAAIDIFGGQRTPVSYTHLTLPTKA